MKEILRENKKIIIIYILIGVLIAFLTNYKAIYFQQIIDNFTNDTLSVKEIIFYGVILILFYIGNYLDEYPSKKIENEIFYGFKLLALNKISKIQFSEYSKFGTGTLTQRIENGARAGKQIVVDFGLGVIRRLLPTVLFSIWFIWNLNKKIAIFILLGYIVVFFITNILLKVLYSIKEKILCNEELLNHYLVRGFMEMVVFRLNRRFPNEIEKAFNSKNIIINSKIKMSMIHEAFFTIFALIVAILNVSILLFAWQDKSISVGSVVAIIMLIENAYTPIAIFNVLFVQYKLDKETYKRFDAFLNKEEDKNLESGRNIGYLKGNINICNLTFKYEKQNIFENFNMTINAGKKIAFVGSSGSGKTTLIELILGLLKYNKGSIKIDGNELSDICLNDFYDRVSYISQDTPIFDGTFKENLVNNDGYTIEEIHNAICKVKLLDVVNNMDKGLDTIIGERGMNLSGGERQRLALARLWFQKNDIVILDEATSALDNITEQEVMDELIELLDNKTVIAIAHRLSSIKNFDCIYVFNKGVIVEQGTFDELLNMNAYFSELYYKTLYVLQE